MASDLAATARDGRLQLGASIAAPNNGEERPRAGRAQPHVPSHVCREGAARMGRISGRGAAGGGDGPYEQGGSAGRACGREMASGGCSAKLPSGVERIPSRIERLLNPFFLVFFYFYQSEWI